MLEVLWDKTKKIIVISIIWGLMVVNLISCINLSDEQVNGTFFKTEAVLQMNELHNGDAKFFGEYIATNIDNRLGLISLDGSIEYTCPAIIKL